MNKEEIKAHGLKIGEFVMLKCEGHKPEIGQVASDENLSNPSIFDEKKNKIFIHFYPQSHHSAIEIDKIESFQLISRIPIERFFS
jgi:hypothetical protein